MKSISLDSTTLNGLLGAVAAELESHTEEIRELDARVGDGDLGVTVGLMAQALREFAASNQETDIGRLLMQCGIAVNRANPSTFGTIIASGLMGGGKAVAGRTSVGLSDWVVLGEAAIESMQSRGKASLGDKTLLDALAPAIAALRKERDAGSDEKTALRAAVKACKEGMEATVAMVAKCGKARVFQEKSVGVQDGGATAMYYMLKAAAGYLDEL